MNASAPAMTTVARPSGERHALYPALVVNGVSSFTGNADSDNTQFSKVKSSGLSARDKIEIKKSAGVYVLIVIPTSVSADVQVSGMSAELTLPIFTV